MGSGESSAAETRFRNSTREKGGAREEEEEGAAAGSMVEVRKRDRLRWTRRLIYCAACQASVLKNQEK